LIGHTGSVQCITIHENKLYAGCWDTISIWNTETYEQIGCFGRHSGTVSCLTHYENKLVSAGGKDNTIWIWNTETYKEIATLEGHTGSVKCLTIHENKLYSGGWDETIRVWKI
jgi:WD40 repeat protein